MKTQSPDTSPEAERVQIELLRNASGARRFALARALTKMTVAMSRRAIQRRHPELSEREVDLRFVALHYGQPLADLLRADLLRRRDGNT
jgi:hypothetical protein